MFKQEMANLVSVLSVRTEQIFNKIQANPGSIEDDEIFLKYIETLGSLIESAEKIIEEK